MDIKDTVKAFKQGEVSRRQMMTALTAIGVGVATVPIGGRSAKAAGDAATYFTWGGYDIPDLFKPYIEKHGTPPSFATFGGSEEGLTKMRAGFTVDVAHPCNQAIPRWVATGLFQPADPAKLSNWGDVIPSLYELEGNMVDGKPYMVPMEWGQTSITYRTDLFELQSDTESWGMLWDERYKGRYGVIASAGDSWWCAAIYAGVPFEEIATDENFEKVAAVLREQRPLVRTYTDDMTTLEQALASGELVAAMTWNESATKLKGEGVPVKFADPKEGALTWVCGAMIHKDAPNPDLAHDIVDSLISVPTGEFLIGEYGYGHSNAKSFDSFSAEQLANLGLSDNPNEVLSAGKFQIPQSQEFETKMNQEFENIKAGF
mgnify:CR=1 FL=1